MIVLFALAALEGVCDPGNVAEAGGADAFVVDDAGGVIVLTGPGLPVGTLVVDGCAGIWAVDAELVS